MKILITRNTNVAGPRMLEAGATLEVVEHVENEGQIFKRDAAALVRAQKATVIVEPKHVEEPKPEEDREEAGEVRTRPEGKTRKRGAQKE